MIFLVLAFLLGGLWRTEALRVTAATGEAVTITCSHSYASTNVKYFCRGACDERKILISSSNNKKHSNGKYSISDEGNTFTVTISDLTKDDSGTYWCGIERIGADTYNEVVLTVTKADPQSNSNTSSLNKLVYIGAGLGVIVLALSVVLLIFFRHRNRGIHASRAMNHDQTEDNLTSSSASPSTVSQVQPDGLLYTAVSFRRHSGISTDAPSTAELTYSTVKHKATP